MKIPTNWPKKTTQHQRHLVFCQSISKRGKHYFAEVEQTFLWAYWLQCNRLSHEAFASLRFYCDGHLGIDSLYYMATKNHLYSEFYSLYYHTTVHKHFICCNPSNPANSVCLNTLNYFSKSRLCRQWLVCLSCHLQRPIVSIAPFSTDFLQFKSIILPMVNKRFEEQINRQRGLLM